MAQRRRDGRGKGRKKQGKQKPVKIPPRLAIQAWQSLEALKQHLNRGPAIKAMLRKKISEITSLLGRRGRARKALQRNKVREIQKWCGVEKTECQTALENIKTI